MKVKDVMKRYIVSIKPEDNVINVLSLLFKMQISGLPVIDEQGKLIGMFTEKDVLSYVLPAYKDKAERFVCEDPRTTRKKFLEFNKLKVSRLMRKDVVTIGEDATLCEAARIMLAQKARRLPVLDRSGKIVGIIARYDALSALAREAGVSINNNKDK